jgi:hypothetical protein
MAQARRGALAARLRSTLRGGMRFGSAGP